MNPDEVPISEIAGGSRLIVTASGTFAIWDRIWSASSCAVVPLRCLQSLRVVNAMAEFWPDPEKPNPRIIMLLSTACRWAISSSNVSTTLSVRCIVASEGSWIEDIK